jgi:hypothetical protein
MAPTTSRSLKTRAGRIEGQADPRQQTQVRGMGLLLPLAN